MHYPTISSDMIAEVRHRRAAHNNSRRIANSAVASKGKLVYYKVRKEDGGETVFSCQEEKSSIMVQTLITTHYLLYIFEWKNIV